MNTTIKNESKVKRTYLQYIANGKKIMLAFRSEESLQKHLDENKISENKIKYISNTYPVSHLPSASGMVNASRCFDHYYGESGVSI